MILFWKPSCMISKTSLAWPIGSFSSIFLFFFSPLTAFRRSVLSSSFPQFIFIFEQKGTTVTFFYFTSNSLDLIIPKASPGKLYHRSPSLWFVFHTQPCCWNLFIKSHILASHMSLHLLTFIHSFALASPFSCWANPRQQQLPSGLTFLDFFWELQAMDFKLPLI